MKPLSVTDHAVIRYMERVMGLDIERLRRHIGRAPAAALAAHPELRAMGTRPTADFTVQVEGWTYFLSPDRAVKTIDQPARPHAKPGRVRRSPPCDPLPDWVARMGTAVRGFDPDDEEPHVRR